MKDIVKFYRNKLRDAGIESWSIDYLLLLSAALNKSREEIIFNVDKINPSAEELKKIDNFFNRRINREPVSYIINKREFYGLDFYIDQDVLDPRPDSETLVDAAIKIINNLKDVTMAEIGIGSGCLSIAIAKNCLNIQKIIASDVSKKALKVCQKNIAKHGLNNKIDLVNSNLMDKISLQHQFDVIISNPPYIKSEDIAQLQDDVRNFEPINALDGGADGLEFYKNICADVNKHLKKDGYLIFEIGYDQMRDVCDILLSHNFLIINKIKDLASNDRVIVAQNH